MTGQGIYWINSLHFPFI